MITHLMVHTFLGVSGSCSLREHGKYKLHLYDDSYIVYSPAKPIIKKLMSCSCLSGPA